MTRPQIFLLYVVTFLGCFVTLVLVGPLLLFFYAHVNGDIKIVEGEGRI